MKPKLWNLKNFKIGDIPFTMVSFVGMTKSARQRGFSLAEILIALLLLSVVSIVLTGVIPATITGMRKAAQRTNGLMLAQNKLDELTHIGFGKLESSETPYPTVEVAGTEYTVIVLVGQAKLSDGTPMDDVVSKLVTIDVSWLDRKDLRRVTQRQVFFKRV